MTAFLKQRQNGFTLIEVIIVIIVAAILGSMMVSYFGTSLTQSSAPIHRLQDALDLQRVMENITADYRSDYDLERLNKTSIGDTGTSQDNDYGIYKVVYNEFIKFEDGNEADADADQKILKVTIQHKDSGFRRNDEKWCFMTFLGSTILQTGPSNYCFRIITYLDITPSILFFCIAETTTALKRCADMGAWMMWECSQPVLFRIRR